MPLGECQVVKFMLPKYEVWKLKLISSHRFVAQLKNNTNTPTVKEREFDSKKDS